MEGLLVVLFVLFWIFLWLIIPAIAVTNLIFFILALVDATKREWPDKTNWILIIVLVPFGALIYWFSEKKKLDANSILPKS